MKDTNNSDNMPILTDTIIISRMYGGDYVYENLGGEAINLIADDKGNNYIYANPYGYIDTKYDDRVSHIILTRYINKIGFEILAVAEIDKQLIKFSKKNLTAEKRHTEAKIQQEHNEENKDMYYKDVALSKIYENQEIGYATFKTKNLLKPTKSIFITNKPSIIVDSNSEVVVINNKNNNGKNLHKYMRPIYITSPSTAYQELNQLIKNKDLWKKYKLNTLKDLQAYPDRFNLLSICGIEDRETSFSNMIAYFLQKYHLQKEFAIDVLKISTFTNLNTKIIRESEKNIDIWIEDDKHIIVIENKIKAHINGIKNKHKFNSENNLSQLSKYVKHAENKATKNNKQQKCHFFILFPKYNNIDITQYAKSKKYKKITYEQIFEFFNKYEDIRNNDSNYATFVNALYIHTKYPAEIEYEKMITMLKNRVDEI